MKSTQRIALILGLVFFLPALFYSVYEISSMKKDEEMVLEIQEIYNKQLEVILFSVNQYADDILNNWASRIETGIVESDNGKTVPQRINDFLTFNSSIIAIFNCDTVRGVPVQKTFTLQDSEDHILRASIDSALTANEKRIQRLVSYKKSGFQKIELLEAGGNNPENLKCLIFISEDAQKKLHLVGIIINPETFIQDLVGPRLQVIARDKFVLSIFNKYFSIPVYSTLQKDTTSIKGAVQTSDFWIFPEYALGIRTSDISLKKLIKERTYTNIILLVGLDIILVIAVVLVFRNVKKEVQLAQNKADFVSNVSHEIRTPLALISMFSETLEMGRVTSEEKKQEYYSIISKETQRLSGIVNKILSFSQTEANKKTLHFGPLHMGTEIREILKTYEFHLKSKGFEYNLIEKENASVIADKEAFVEVFINLIDNAVKYSSDQKHIEITTGRENGNGYLTVKDQGMGISREDQKHIFDKFYRVSSGNLAKSKGTGLGLSLVKQLMEAQKGKITVRSELGKGSSFTLYFPLEVK